MEVVEYILKRSVTITRQATTLCKKERAAEKEVKGSEKKPMTTTRTWDIIRSQKEDQNCIRIHGALLILTPTNAASPDDGTECRRATEEGKDGEGGCS